MLQLELTEEELHTMLFTLKVMKYKLPKEYNAQCKELYDKFRHLVWETIKYEWIKDANI